MQTASSFFPTRSTVYGHHAALDRLSEAVLNSFTRPGFKRLSWRLPRTIFGIVLTFGLFPLWRLSRLLGRLIAYEQQQCLHLKEWLALEQVVSVRRPEDVDGWHVLSGSGRLMIAGAAGALLWYFVHSGESIGGFWYEIFAYPRTAAALWFNGLVVSAAALHVIRIVLHRNALHRFSTRCNAAVDASGALPFSTAPPKIGIAPLWLVAGVLFSFGGAPWPMAVLFAAGTQRNYMLRRNAGFARQWADRVRLLLDRRRPAVPLPRHDVSERHCANAQCRAPLLMPARFCPRCGTTAPTGTAG